MKIIISSYDDLKNPYYGGGGAKVVHEIARRLAVDNRVTVVTGKYPGAKDEIIDQVVYLRTGIAGGGGKLGQLVYQLGLYLKILSGNFDVWVESLTPPFSSSLLPVLTKKPVVGLVEMLAGEDMTRKYKLPVFLPVQKLGLRLYKSFIVPSEQIKAKISPVNSKAEVTVIPNGVEIPRITRRDKKHILFLGRIEVDQKGLDLLTGAYAAIAKKIKYPLIIAGSGEKNEVARLKELVKEKDVGKSIRLAGRVGEDKKRALLKEALVVVVSSRYETFSITALEAMAQGAVLVVFDIPGFSWIPDAAAVKIPAFDQDQLASQILKLSRDRELTEAIGQTARTFVRQYSWAKIANRYLDYLKQVSGKNNHEQNS